MNTTNNSMKQNGNNNSNYCQRKLSSEKIPRRALIVQTFLNVYWDKPATTRALPEQIFRKEMCRLMTKPTKWFVRPAKTQISLDIRPV